MTELVRHTLIAPACQHLRFPMSIESTAFGTTRLSQDDAAKFKSQMTYGRSTKEAHASLKSGKGLLKTLSSKGAVTVRVKK